MNNFKRMLFVVIFALVMCVFVGCGDKGEITFEKDTINVTLNHEFILNPVVTGDDKEVKFDFDESAFEKVSDGKFKAIKLGDYKVKVSLKANEEVFGEVTVKVDSNHTFNQKTENEKYLVDGTLCGEKVKYYYSCICGEKGEETFENGKVVEHDFDQKVESEDYLVPGTLCGEKAKYYFSCECGEKGTESFESEKVAGHVFEQEVLSEDYLASAATCSEKAKYYFSCSCGEKGEETFESGETLPHTFDQKVVDEKYACDEYKYYYSCACGEKGEETFGYVEPVETSVVLADDSVLGLEPGTVYEYKKEQYIVGLTAFATIVEALTYATEIVYVADGEYNENITISKSNIKLLGNNANVDPNIQTRSDESVLVNTLNLAKDVKGVTVSGFTFTLEGQFKCNSKGGNDDIVFEYNVFDSEITYKGGYDSKAAEVLFNPNSGSYNKNLTVRNNRFLTTGGKTYHVFLTNIENFYAYGNYFEGTYAQAYADSIIFDDIANYGGTGEIVIENNEFYNICQYAIIFWDYLDINLKVIGNKFENCGIDGANDGYIRAILTLVAHQTKATKSTVLFEKNELINVDCGLRIQTNQPEKVEAEVKDNKFISWAEPSVITSNGTNTGAYINAENNYFGQEVTDDSFSGVTSWANPYTNIADVPVYERADLVYLTELKITNKVSSLLAYSEYKIEFSYKPDNATYTKVVFKSSDESIATVNDNGRIKVLGTGKVTIYAYAVFDESIVDSFEFEVIQRPMIDAYYDGNGVLKPNDQVQINTTVKGVDEPGVLEFSSSDESVATVDEDGLVFAKGKGLVIITIKCGDLETKVGLTVLGEDQELSDLMKLLIENNNGTVFYDVINYIGYEEGFEKVPHKVYGPVNNFWNGELPEITENMVPTSNENYTGQYMTSVEYVVVHDTGAANPGATAAANSGWCVNSSNTGTSWHYTTGNDGIYKQLEDNMIAWHAGDWSQKDPGKFQWYDTGIKFDKARPTVTIGDDGFFYIEGVKTIVEAPRKEDGSIEKNINQVGLVCVKGENGNYMIPTTWISDESGYPVCVYGGNSNGIGIESCVNSGSDVWLTWQYTAKLCANLLITHNLSSDRVVFHNNFTNKTCPNTMITNNLVDSFIKLVEVEYEVAKNYSDYEITFTSHNPEIMDNTGRIINAPDYTTNVTYTITVSKDGVTEEVTLNALVPGRFGLK